MIYTIIGVIIAAVVLATGYIGLAAWKRNLIEAIECRAFLNAQIYPCNQLFIDYQFNKPKDEVIVDMSLYEKYKVIFIQVFSEMPPDIGCKAGVRRVDQVCVANICGMWMWKKCCE